METIVTAAAAAMHRDRMLATAARRRMGKPRHRPGVRVRVGLGLVRLGLAVAQPLTVGNTHPHGRPAPS